MELTIEDLEHILEALTSLNKGNDDLTERVTKQLNEKREVAELDFEDCLSCKL